MANRKLVVEIVGDADSLQRTFRQVGRETQTFGAKLGQIAKGAAVAAGALGVTGLAFAVATGTKELREQQRVAAQTAAAIKSTGGVAGVTARHINDLGLALSNLSGVDDELIKQGANLLLSFENIRNSAGKGNDIFDRATKAALDFATRTGRDVPAAAVLLGKALEDPATKVSALARAGVVFSTAQKKVIADLVNTGHALEAQKIILGELEERFGGAAEAAGGTLPGRLRVLQERFQDLTGDLLTAFLPSLNRAVIAVTKIVQSFSAWSAKSENQRKLQKIVNDVVDRAVGIFQGLRDVLVPLARIANDVADALGGMRQATQLLVAALIASKVVAFTGAITGLSTQALVATGRVSALRVAMLRLGAIGLITLGVEVIINRDAIDKKVSGFLEGHGLGFFAGNKKIDFPFEFNVKNIDKFKNLRDNMAALKGEGDLVVKGLDKIIARLETIAAKKIVEPGEGRLGTRGRTPAEQAARDARATAAADEQDDRRAGRRAERLAKAAAARAKAVFDASLGQLGIALERAQQTTGLQDDLRILRQTEAVLRERLKTHRDDLDLQSQLVNVQGQQLDIERQLAQAAKDHARALAEAAVAARKSSQFEALGLTGTGEARIPGVGALRNRLGNLQSQIKGTLLDTPKTQGQLQRIAKVLAGKFGAVGKDVRSAILQMFNDIANALQQGDKKVSGGAGGEITRGGIRSTQKLLKGLGLTAEQAAELTRRNLGVAAGSHTSAFGFAVGGVSGRGTSGGDFVISGPITVVTNDPNDLMKKLQKKGRRSSGGRRGRHGGANLGLQ